MRFKSTRRAASATSLLEREQVVPRVHSENFKSTASTFAEGVPAPSGDNPEAPPMSDRLLSKREACAMLGISPATADRLAAKGILERIKIGGRTLFRHSDLQRLIREGASGAGRAA